MVEAKPIDCVYKKVPLCYGNNSRNKLLHECFVYIGSKVIFEAERDMKTLPLLKLYVF